MKWIDASHENPGYTAWYASPDRDPKIVYAIRHRRKNPKIGWRVFVRTREQDPLRTIFIGETLKEAKQFVEDAEKTLVH